MVWWDFLKNILPDSLIKVVNDNRQIIVHDNEIIAGDKTINDPEIINKIFEGIKKYKNDDTFPFQILHEDLGEDYLKYESISIEQKENLKLLKNMLPMEDVECILMARRVHLAFNEKNNNLAQDLLKQLDKNYPKKGRKVFNLIHAGYFDDLVLPMINVSKSQYNEMATQKFKIFFDDIEIPHN